MLGARAHERERVSQERASEDVGYRFGQRHGQVRCPVINPIPVEVVPSVPALASTSVPSSVQSWA